MVSDPKKRLTLDEPLLAYFDSIGAPAEIRDVLVDFVIAWEWLRGSKEGRWFLEAFEEDGGGVGPSWGPSEHAKAFDILKRAEEIIQATMDEIDTRDLAEMEARGELEGPFIPHEEVMRRIGLRGPKEGK